MHPFTDSITLCSDLGYIRFKHIIWFTSSLNRFDFREAYLSLSARQVQLKYWRHSQVDRMARNGVRLCLHKNGLINKLQTSRFGCIPFLQSLWSYGMMRLVCSTVTTAQRSGSCPLQFSSCVLPHSVPLLQPVHVPCPPQRKSVCLCLSVHHSASLTDVCLSACLSVHHSVSLSTCLSVHHSVSLSTCLSVCLSTTP